MGSWQSNHRYVLVILLALLFGIWIGWISPAFNQENLTGLEKLSCIVLIEGDSCPSELRILRNGAQLWSFEPSDCQNYVGNDDCSPLLKDLDQQREDLATLIAADAGGLAGDKLDDIRETQILIDAKEKDLSLASEQIIPFWIIIFGLGLQIGIAFVAANWFQSWIFKPLIRRLSDREVTIQARINNLIASPNWPKEEINRLLFVAKTDESAIWLKDFRLFNDQVVIKPKQQDELDWKASSKMLFNISKLNSNSTDPNQSIDLMVKAQYRLVRSLIFNDVVTKIVERVIPLVIFFLMYLLTFLLFQTSSKLGEALKAWPTSIGSLLLGWGLAILTYLLLQNFVRWLTEKTTTELDDILAAVLSGPLATLVFSIFMFTSFASIPGYVKYLVSFSYRSLLKTPFNAIVFFVVITWLFVFIFNRIVVYALNKWAARTSQSYDDMFVRVIQFFGTFLIIAGIGAILLTQFESEINDATGTSNFLLPYVIFVSVLTAILGYSAQEGIENFFGGLLLQVEPPFELGDRLVLDTGEITDVREIGMRTTRLYNVLENTEISIPNRLMSTQKITNLSRPDLQLRIPINIYLPHDGYTLKAAEGVLLDIAYFEEEVDQARVSSSEISPELRSLGRIALEEHEQNLVQVYSKVLNVRSERILGTGGYDSVAVFPSLTNKLKRIKELRQEYGKVKSEQLEAIKSALTPHQLKNWDLDSLNRSIRDIAIRTIWPDRGYMANAGYDQTITEVRIERHLDLNTQSLKKVIKSLAEVLKRRGGGRSRYKEFRSYARSWSPKRDEEILSLWYQYGNKRRYAILHEIAACFETVGEFLYSIGDEHRDVRKHLDQFLAELDKEPDVHSSFEISQEGMSYVHISYRIFATHLERRFEVMHKLHKDIQRRFKQEGIKIISLWEADQNGNQKKQK